MIKFYKALKKILNTVPELIDGFQKYPSYKSEKLEFDKKIRNLESQLKVTNLVKNYWWIIITAVGIGFSISEIIKNVW
ncbi:hypothetical protein F7642_12670 [Tenacibaculum finnmarkense genomovar ulcerans]|uniref:hypothetical protein n=1 Tax=Tenacibaculum TaxID=104267 RepID=UPI00187B84BC|nr:MULTISPECIES: hypothetical protein [Tenacibaculum]MCD8435936.1 hypothetical protein [Tenacibaculum dicentrarchi]MBE7635176.1 hypothetical protein [Tenacibaculum finnmarkense genomovar ulcerans]MCD8431127.1 hypothetical protein [Tenacibaculum finnmarkense genomovar ulcerans]WBX72850.1 hypothetical protein PG913_08020 [Tenacibaculum pacificus]WBX72981.1 hypothetical protein PG913_08740 [Tenacibaculum pacificus]